MSRLTRLKAMKNGSRETNTSPRGFCAYVFSDEPEIDGGRSRHLTVSRRANEVLMSLCAKTWKLASVGQIE